MMLDFINEEPNWDMLENDSVLLIAFKSSEARDCWVAASALLSTEDLDVAAQKYNEEHAAAVIRRRDLRNAGLSEHDHDVNFPDYPYSVQLATESEVGYVFDKMTRAKDTRTNEAVMVEAYYIAQRVYGRNLESYEDVEDGDAFKIALQQVLGDDVPWKFCFIDNGDEPYEQIAMCEGSSEAYQKDPVALRFLLGLTRKTTYEFA